MIFNKKTFRQIPGFPNYWINRVGDVYSVPRVVNNRIFGGFLRPSLTNKGYHTVTLSNVRGQATRKIHQLVAICFIPNPRRLRDINHKNGVKTDNRTQNLEWVTFQENIDHAWRTGLRRNPPSGDSAQHRKLTSSQVKKIRNLLADGVYQYRIASMFSVTQACISDIHTGVTWNDI